MEIFKRFQDRSEREREILRIVGLRGERQRLEREIGGGGERKKERREKKGKTCKREIRNVRRQRKKKTQNEERVKKSCTNQ